MLVGGKGGDIYGTWTIIPCMFDSEEKETSCDEDEEEEGLMQSSFTISEDKFARKLAGIYLNKSLNYPTSNFRRLFNHYLSKGPGGDLFLQQMSCSMNQFMTMRTPHLTVSP